MLCQNCNVNPATVFVHRVINGQEREFHLCNQCAKQLEMQISFEDLFHGFLDTFLSNDQKQIYGQPNDLIRKKVCPKCGFTSDDFKNVGKLGCDQCYKTFREDLIPILRNIQAGTRHNGKVPGKSLLEISYQNRIAKLQNDLHKAIDNEEYEQAAKLRDEIKKIKEEHNG